MAAYESEVDPVVPPRPLPVVPPPQIGPTRVGDSARGGTTKLLAAVGLP
jgi:hypothetical protein